MTSWIDSLGSEARSRFEFGKRGEAARLAGLSGDLAYLRSPIGRPQFASLDGLQLDSSSEESLRMILRLIDSTGVTPRSAGEQVAELLTPVLREASREF